MTDILALASKSNSREVIIMLDCCHSGAFGQAPLLSGEQAILREGLTIICASRSTEAALESIGSGLFTSLVCEALGGAAANLTGDVTVASLYSFVDLNMGPWQQRPMFKANLSRLAVLRKCDPLVDLTELRLLPEYFKTQDQVAAAIPQSTSDSEVTPDKLSRLRHFRAYRLAGLIKTPVHGAALSPGEPFLLTSLGRYYWHLATQKLI
jgi:hypothetical protein